MGLTERHWFENEDVPENHEWDLEDAVYNSCTNKKPENSVLTEKNEMTMTDREKVIKAWKIFRDSNPYEICSGCEFRAIKEPEYCMGQMIEDTIALLKERETVPVIQRKVMSMLVWCCGSCDTVITDGDKFCRMCGKKVKWE